MAGSASAISAFPIVRQGKQLIIPAPPPGQPAILPPLCIKCGAPADGKPLEKTIYWHHPALYLLILAGLLIYAIVAMVVRKAIKVRMPLCVRHTQRRGIAVTLAWILPLVGVADAIILSQFNIDGGVVALLTVALIVTGLVLWGVVGTPLRPKSIDQYRGIFIGCCEIFLQQFPDGSQMPPISTVPVPQIPPPPPPPLA